jgi:hypothetical protein
VRAVKFGYIMALNGKCLLNYDQIMKLDYDQIMKLGQRQIQNRPLGIKTGQYLGSTK